MKQEGLDLLSSAGYISFLYVICFSYVHIWNIDFQEMWEVNKLNPTTAQLTALKVISDKTKKNKRYQDWKGRSEIDFIHRWHHHLRGKSYRLYKKKKATRNKWV